MSSHNAMFFYQWATTTSERLGEKLYASFTEDPQSCKQPTNCYTPKILNTCSFTGTREELDFTNA